MTREAPNSLTGFASAAERVLNAADWTYLMAGALPGQAGDNNIRAWDALRLRPRVLRGVTQADTSTTALGAPLSSPIFVAPNGRATRYHPEGERAIVGAAAAHQIGALLASSVSDSIGALRTSAPQALLWSQLYMSSDRGFMKDRLALAHATGVGAIVLTVDLLPDDRAPKPPLLAPASWETPGGAEPAPLFAATSLDDLAWLCAISTAPVVVKGVLRADDAAACISAGAKGLIVSNHGGNQLMDSITSPAALPEIVALCGEQAEIYVDGGIRSGSAIFKAIALGARAVMIGRPFSHALAAAGEQGVAKCISILAHDLQRTMRLCGASSIAEIDQDLLAD